MISDNILKVVIENKDKTFISKDRGFKGHIIGFKNNLIIVEWELIDGSTVFSEEYSIENLEKYIEIEKPFKVGDIVKVVDDGELFEYYDDWFQEYNIPYEYALRYCWGNGPDVSGLASHFKIIAIHKHLKFKDENLYLIQKTDEEAVYLIGERGIENIK